MSEHQGVPAPHEVVRSGAFVLKADPPKVSIALTPAHAAEGFVDALERLRERIDAEAPIWSLCVALQEACEWLHTIKGHLGGFGGDLRVQGLLFVRNRGHHWLAAPIEHNRDLAMWTWRPADFFPEPEADGDGNAKMRACYVAKLEGQPVFAVLDAVEVEVRRRLGVHPAAAAS